MRHFDADLEWPWEHDLMRRDANVVHARIRELPRGPFGELAVA
jgi:hypothetical protein